MTRGIVVYAKKHDEQDADHSFGMDLGVTVKQAFDTIKKSSMSNMDLFKSIL